MFRILIILSLILLTSCPESEQIVNIPDPEFLSALITRGFDTNHDGLISYEEAEVVVSLNVDSENISDLTGIEEFSNLDSLDCTGNVLTQLNVSDNSALRFLACGNNRLSILDISNNKALLHLNCSYNFQLTSLNVSGLKALMNLFCSYGQLTSLDVSGNIALKWLECCDNQLSSLDISNNTALQWLDCSRNKLTSLDVSQNVALQGLILTEMPGLVKVCTWTMPFPPPGVWVTTSGSPNVYFTAECIK